MGLLERFSEGADGGSRCGCLLRHGLPGVSRREISDLGFQVFPKRVQVEVMEIVSLVMSQKTKLIRKGSMR